MDAPAIAGAAIGTLVGLTVCGVIALFTYRIRPTRKLLLRYLLLLVEWAALMAFGYLGYLAGLQIGPVAALVLQWFCSLVGGIALIVFHALVTAGLEGKGRRKRSRPKAPDRGSVDPCAAPVPEQVVASETCEC